MKNSGCLELVLVPNRDDRPRFVRVVSYEAVSMFVGTSSPAEVVAVRRDYQWLNVARDDRPDDWRFVCVSVTELHRPPRADREWPRHIDRDAPEPEWLRRLRIMELRERLHVDPRKGQAEPDWVKTKRLGDAAKSLDVSSERRAA